jgi:hypothetical protein
MDCSFFTEKLPNLFNSDSLPGKNVHPTSPVSRNFHGLPVFPGHLEGLTAIITGANGIPRYYMLRVLAQAPGRWSKIYRLSRRPPAIPEGLPEVPNILRLIL